MHYILFIIHPAKGPLNSTFRLAALFQQRGGKVAYVVPDTLKDFICRQGFEAIVADIAGDPESLLRISPLRNNHVRCAILDADQLSAGILLYRYAFSKIVVNTTCLSDKAPGIPPFFSSIIPSRSWYSRLRIALTWHIWFTKKWWRTRMGKLLHNYDPYHEALAKKYNFPFRECMSFDRAWLIGFRNYPEFILYPPELDFPRKVLPPDKYFTGPLIYHPTEDAPFDWSRIPADKPLVYCALGTLAHVYYPDYISFFRKLIAVFREQPDVSLLLSVGEHCREEELGDIPDNVHVYTKVPQMQILPRCRMMITHGGSNSIKECIYHGVPMLIYPLGEMTDQHGNAARIVYHRLGVRANIRKSSSCSIKNDMAAVLMNKDIRKNISGMRTVFHAYEQQSDILADQMESFM
ncbi:glycosyltransferase family 1 protein [Chitinophaga sp. Mgbs1]|uniref:Glycosyltransferase family 1 protein n=1 Tax=Chitinophaga solisilvae TaxID=1233460 RepID=A0A433WLE5_9BACT|nr:glycosyltransferase family 1 protein [Chitinophaga solisilvae]